MINLPEFYQISLHMYPFVLHGVISFYLKKKTGLKKFHPDFVGNDAEDNKMTGYDNSATSSSPTPTPTHGPRIIPEKYEVLASSNYLKIRLRINCYTS